MATPRYFWEIVDGAQAAAAHPSDLALPLLEHLSHRAVRGEWSQLTDPREWNSRYRDHGTQVALNVSATLTWMLSNGFLCSEPGDPPLARVRATRLGREALEHGRGPDFIAVARAAEGALHPEIELNALPALLRGDADTAVFSAMKHVEVAVRHIGKLAPNLIGTNLMAKAFDPTAGPLRAKGLPPELSAELQAEQQLFMGAVGCLKNPASHRYPDVALAQAYRVLVFASFLLVLAESRHA